jgi:hypothetical protein
MMTPTAHSQCGFVDAAIYSSATGIADIAKTQIYSRKADPSLRRMKIAVENDHAKVASKQIFRRGEYFGLTRE